MWFIGDLHREWATYQYMIDKMIVGEERSEESFHHWFDDMPGSLESQASLYKGKGLNQSLQVGDWGIFNENNLKDSPATENHRYFRGNHDHPELCNQDPYHLGDFGYIPDMEMFWAAGGFSIDRYRRTEGLNWWANEELTASQWWRAHEVYADTKPKIMVSHECPNIAKAAALSAAMGGVFLGKEITSGTEMMLQQMYDHHQPDIWIFGHYHHKLDQVIGKTRFICCGAVNIAPVKDTVFESVKDTVFEIPGLTWPDEMHIIN